MNSENTIAIIIEPAQLALVQELDGNWNSLNMLMTIKLLDKKPISSYRASTMLPPFRR